MRYALPTICLLVVLAFTGWSSAAAWTPAGGSAVRSGRANPVVSTGGATHAGGTLNGTVEGIAAPVLQGDPAGATVTVRLNGWVDDQPKLQFDEVDGVWRFKYDIPPGMKGATITIVVTDSATGQTTTQTIIVT